MINNSDHKTELHKSVENADVEHVRKLIRDGADVNACDAKGQIPMPRYPGILQNIPEQAEILKILIDAGANLTSCYCENSQCPFFKFERMQVHGVLRYGSREMVRIIIESNMDLSATFDGDFISPLHYLAKNKNEGIAEELRRKQLVFNLSGSFKNLPVSYAIQSTNPRMLEYFLKIGFESTNGTDFAFLLMSCYRELLTEEMIEVIELLLEYKFDPLPEFEYILAYYRIESEERRLKSWPIVKQVVAHLAIQYYFETSNDNTISLIYLYDDVKQYYELCKKQVKDMQNSAIYKSLTFFNLLVTNEKEITSFALNRQLVSTLKNIIQLPRWIKFYSRIIQKRLATIFKIDEYRKISATKICTIFGQLYNQNDIISNEIVCFLNYEDLERLFFWDDD